MISDRVTAAKEVAQSVTALGIQWKTSKGKSKKRAADQLYELGIDHPDDLFSYTLGESFARNTAWLDLGQCARVRVAASELMGLPSPIQLPLSEKPDKDNDAVAYTLLNELKASKPVNKELYRGMNLTAPGYKALMASLKAGTFTEALSSYSESEEIAKSFTLVSGPFGVMKNRHQVWVVLEPGAKAIRGDRIGQYIGVEEEIVNDREYISGGDFAVVSMDTEGSATTVHIRQTSVPITIA